MSSDNIELLSITNNLAGGATFQSDPQILGQYISLSIIGAASQSITIALQFSADGINYDYNVTRNVSVGDNQLFTHPVSAKWTRVRVTNNGVIATTYLRVIVYGVPSNSSLVAQIGKIGNLNPEIAVSNLPTTSFGEMMVCEDRPQNQYMFCVGTGGDLLTQTWKLPYRGLKSYCSAAGNFMSISNGNVGLGDTFIDGVRGYLAGAPFRYHPGQGIESKFTAKFVQGLKYPYGDHPSTLYAGIGSINSSTNRPRDGYFFGYGDPTAANDSDIGIVYLNNDVRTFYPRTSWNVDKCDGTNIMPAIDFGTFNVFEITFQYLGYGAARFYVENPSTGLLQLVHVINRVNDATATNSNLSNPSLGLILYAENEPGVAVLTLDSKVSMASFTYTIQGNLIRPDVRTAFTSAKTGITTEAVVLNIRCDSTFYARDNEYPIDLDYLSAGTDGTKVVRYTMYLNPTLTGASWVTNSQYTLPVSFDTVGTISVPGQKIFAWTMAKADHIQLYLKETHIHMNPGDIISITAFSTSSNDVELSASIIYH